MNHKSPRTRAFSVPIIFLQIHCHMEIPPINQPHCRKGRLINIVFPTFPGWSFLFYWILIFKYYRECPKETNQSEMETWTITHIGFHVPTGKCRDHWQGILLKPSWVCAFWKTENRVDNNMNETYSTDPCATFHYSVIKLQINSG